MKKKLELYFSSFKASACNKPTALLMFIMLIVVVTIATGIALRPLFSGVEYEIFEGVLKIQEIDKKNPPDYSDYKAIGGKLKHLNDKEMFDKSRYRNNISLSCYKPNIINATGQKIEIGFIQIKLEVAPFFFTQEELDSGVQIMYGDKDFFRKLSLKEGDNFTFEGSQFVLYENQKEASGIIIPYTANIKDYAYERFPEVDKEGNYVNENRFCRGRIVTQGKQNIPSKHELSILESIGLKVEKPTVGAHFVMPLILLVLVLIGGVASMLVVYNYILKINSRRYAIYKIIGMSPLIISTIMMTESFVLSSVGVAVGLMVELMLHALFPIDVYMLGNRLMWVHCMSLIAVPLIVVMTTVGIKIIAHAKAVPVSAKYLQ